MKEISGKYVELSQRCHGYKKEFFYIDEEQLCQTDDNQICGNILFKIPAYLRIAEGDNIFNNTEAVLVSNQLTYFLLSIMERPDLFESDGNHSDKNLEELAKVYKDFDGRTVIRKQTFNFKKTVLTESGKVPFKCTAVNKKKAKSGDQFLKLEIEIGENKNFIIDSMVVFLAKNVHNSEYS